MKTRDQKADQLAAPCEADDRDAPREADRHTVPREADQLATPRETDQGDMPREADDRAVPRETDRSGAPLLVGLGELIWDFLPGGRQLGGAPTNFACMSRLLGNESAVASRIGADDLGAEASARLAALRVSTKYLQIDREHPTGTVGVRLDERGEANFALNENSAWDYLEWTNALAELALKADAVCFGTLGQRAVRARRTIIRFLEATRPGALRIFDVNLRHSFFDAEMLERSLQLANVVKLNQPELSILRGMLRLAPDTEEKMARQLLDLFKLDMVAITRGERGSLLVTAGATCEHGGIPVQVKDTIGAGDAFIAALAHYHLRRAPLPLISEAANRTGAWIATQSGATPSVDAQALKRILRDLDEINIAPAGGATTTT
ncbi:MAG TPA: carbohydrate kinase [Pyrinomonadaceae bacterium]|nr:carbohydrate kinase [Pyrinomonadaceae bacterium]